MLEHWTQRVPRPWSYQYSAMSRFGDCFGDVVSSFCRVHSRPLSKLDNKVLDERMLRSLASQLGEIECTRYVPVPIYLHYPNGS
jgi:hypothetical protein